MINDRYSLSIVIGTFNRVNELKQIIDDIDKKSINDKEVIIIDGGSTDGTIDFLSEQIRHKDNLVVILDKNRDKNKKMKRTLQECYNFGFKLATGRYIIHLNDDCRLDEQSTKWGQEAINFIEAPSNEMIGMLSLQIGEKDDSGIIKHRFSYDDILGSNLMFANHALIGRRFFERLGWWDEGFVFYAADNDLALSVRANGMHVVGFDKADKIIHTAIQDDTRKINETTALFDFARLREKWGTKIKALVDNEMKKEKRFRSIKEE